MKRLTNGVYIVRGGKTYRITRNASCTKRSCSLFKRGVCDNEDCVERLPCDDLWEFYSHFDIALANLKEVRND